jgi:hypothetical protein
MLTYNELKEKPKEFLAVTSLTVTEFELILPVFCHKYGELLTPGLCTQQSTHGMPPTISFLQHLS